MKIVKLIGFLLILSSCNQYLGTIEPDYIPSNDIEEVFLSNAIVLDNNEEFKIGEVLYPPDKKLNFKNSIDFQKVTTIDKKTNFLFLENEIYYNKKNDFYSLNKNDFKEINRNKIKLNKDEEIIHISSFEKNLFVLTNQGKVFKLLQNNFELIQDLQIFLSQNTFSKSSKIIAFSVFGDVIEIDLKNNIFAINGNFDVNHGITKSSNIYPYNNINIILYNSGTLVFLNQQNNNPETNYYLEDLNILSQVGIFEEFIDAPFHIDNFIYFIEKKGLVSVFNPVTSEILWETDISSPIIDYFIDENKNLYVLTYNKVNIFSSQGQLQKDISHKLENPFNFWIDDANLYLANQDGLYIINLDGDLIYSIKQKFQDFLKVFNSNNQYYFVDSKNLYTLIE
jgi:hypothetical protein